MTTSKKLHDSNSSSTPSLSSSSPLLPLSSSSSSRFISAYGPKLRVRFTCTGASRTKQSFKDECDINNIMARYMETGVLDFVQRGQPRFLDCTGYDYNHAMNIVADARSRFAELPSQLRERFGNNPGLFLDFVHDPDNAEELREMGILKPLDARKAEAATPPAPPPAKAAPAASGEAAGASGQGEGKVKPA